MGLHSYANQRDDNEQEIVDALLAVGASVDRVDEPCDLIVGYRGATFLLEVKLPPGPRGGTSHSRPTPKQVEFAGRHKGQYVVVRSVEEALRAVGAIRNGEASDG